MKFVIPLDPRTKKNHSQIVRGRLVPSKQYTIYRKEALKSLLAQKRPQEPINYPVNVKALYFMKTHRKVDRPNLENALLDVLVDAGILEDDNCTIAATADGSKVLYDKENPRTEVEIEKLCDDREKTERK